MTREQKIWLDSHPNHQAIGELGGGGERYIERGLLRADGTFVPAVKGRPLGEEPGAFAVGVRVHGDAPGQQDPRGYVGNWNEGGGNLQAQGGIKR
jgi:hypothetical protein